MYFLPFVPSLKPPTHHSSGPDPTTSSLLLSLSFSTPLPLNTSLDLTHQLLPSSIYKLWYGQACAPFTGNMSPAFHANWYLNETLLLLLSPIPVMNLSHVSLNMFSETPICTACYQIYIYMQTFLRYLYALNFQAKRYADHLFKCTS
jgi:hypothetical protein